MNDAAVLGAMKWRETCNRMRIFVLRSRFKLAVIVIFSAAFWVSLYKLFHLGLWYVHRVALTHNFRDLVGSMFYIFFFALTLMLVFSNAIILYTGLFRSRETSFLLALPARPESIFVYKFGESLTFSSWAFLFLGTPMMAAYGRLYEAGWMFYVSAAFFLGAYMFIPATLGAMVAMIVTVYVPRTRRGLVAAGATVGLLLIMMIASKVMGVGSGPNADLKLAIEVFESISFSRNPMLPSYWVAKGILSMAEGQGGTGLFFFGLIAANVLFLTALAHAMSARLVPRGWHVSQGLRSARKYRERGGVDRFFSALLFFVDPEVKLIVIKDVKSFLRDPVQWSQFLIFFGLLAIYFTNLRTFGYEERDMPSKNLIAQMNLLATSLTLATFASRFIFPQLSLEGRRFWVIGMAPMEREKILFGKLSLSFTCSLLISEALIVLSSLMLKTPASLAILHGVSLFCICLGLSGLAVGLGARYPNFNEDNPSKIVVGFGGTLNLVLSLMFVLTVLAIQAVPCFYYYGGGLVLTAAKFRGVIAGAMGAIMVVSLAACLAPMWVGLRAIQRLEV